ncbi:ABC transporter ATP-binding protein [Thalassospira lucentensis]|uniref:ABC transporter ATP-binding protein n=1 Tax=Thalassospira lucentensis TaxID=168935 RepID=UPI00142E03D1|nr:ABC transporter ATP-binding protein [Thalassospira lucentensis]NIZ01933.1 ABC transporter ATP-binding protein [Thalassospira lucentensis]
MSTPTAHSTQPVLQIKDLSISLPRGADRPFAGQNIDMQIMPGDILCVVGESGSGKSMLTRAVLGLLPAPHVQVTSGKIELDGINLLSCTSAEMRELRGDRIGMIFQEPMTALNPLLTVGRQIDEVLETHRDMTASERREKVIAALDEVQMPNPSEVYDAYPHQLSGGQRQRAMIAMALILSPGLLIADEPTTALDVTTQAQILNLINILRKDHGTAVMFITHDFGVVAEIADHVVVMEKGLVVETGTARDVLDSPKHNYTRALIAAVPGLTPHTRPSIKAKNEGLAIQALYKTFTSSGGLLGKPIRKVEAVKNINLNVQPGEILGIVGESGSGKSTLARLIIRLIEPDSGEVILEGENFLTMNPLRLRNQRHRIQMIFQDPYSTLNPRHKVGRIIAEGPKLRGCSSAEATERTNRLLSLVGLGKEAANRFPHEFSGGQRQRIGIARALAIEPDFLLADEAVSALDVSVQKQVLDLLLDIRDKFNLAIVFITHDLCVAAQICDRVAVMKSGEIVEHGLASDVLNTPQHPYTKTLLSSLPGQAWLKTR